MKKIPNVFTKTLCKSIIFQFICQYLNSLCHLKVKSELFLLDLKFKSEPLCSYNLEPIIIEEKGFKLWYNCIRNLKIIR